MVKSPLILKVLSTTKTLRYTKNTKKNLIINAFDLTFFTLRVFVVKSPLILKSIKHRKDAALHEEHEGKIMLVNSKGLGLAILNKPRKRKPKSLLPHSIWLCFAQ